MKQWIFGLGFAHLLLVTSAWADFAASDEYALEPCINGGVSARGLFVSQAAEDRHFAARIASETDSRLEGVPSVASRLTTAVE